ncbi:MAG: hypothetical protein BWY63_02835 [Chloroflexi bacterium ADurb.Bin360]|nr:MAG: hypothetical protein BWY63_02835 [Chloroflexi bacterium ADurb.Bin360]
MDHRLLITRLIIPELRHLLQRLSDAADIAVPENAKTAGEEWLLDAITFYVLCFEEGDERLSHGQPNLLDHVCLPIGCKSH